MKSVELHQAWTWDCDRCGKENYARAVTVGEDELDADELLEITGALGIEPGEEFESGELHHCLVSQPEIVVCAACGEKFETREPQR